MTLRRAGAFWGRKGAGSTPFTPLIDSSYASFGTIRLYDDTGLAAMTLVNDNSLVKIDIPWDGERPNIGDINSHLGVEGGLVKTLYSQKDMSTNGLICGNNATQSTWPLLNINGAGTDKPSSDINNSPTNYLEISGDKSALFADCSYSVLVLAVDIKTLTALGSILGVESRTVGFALCAININADYTTGGVIGGRYTNGGTFQTVAFSYNFSSGPCVITGIWDYVRRQLIVRINGVQLGIRTDFAIGTRSENANIGRVQIGRFATSNPCNNDFFGATFFRSSVNAEAPPISEIEAVENRYMTYLGI